MVVGRLQGLHEWPWAGGQPGRIYALVQGAIQSQSWAVILQIEREIRVAFRHRVIFTQGLFASGSTVLREVLAQEPGTGRARVLVVLDDGLAMARPGLPAAIEAWFASNEDSIELVAPPIRMAGGERIKNAYFHVSEVHERIDRNGIDRHNYVMAIGGGALLDMVGLAAATAHRGVRLVRVPTTTLAQADSAVGVKNGINAFGKKNFIGTFCPPDAVVNDFEFIEALPPRDRRAGLSEAVKVACIRDAAFFREIESGVKALAAFEPAAMRPVIVRSAELHLDHIAGGGDPFEYGSARPLDFGHWAAHKLEPLSDYRIRHGEAVAIGMALDVLYSRNAGLLDAAEAERVLRVLEGLGFELYANELHYADSAHSLVLLQGLEEFRQHLGGRLTITLLREIGRGVEVNAMERGWIVAALEELRVRSQRRALAAAG
ncbi:MAG: 3-dehydroquinate synthase [Verrucomicrobiae bacterium]|nr:3-dehydroquinate synthase [Verrucomicrobiae bacterium]